MGRRLRSLVLTALATVVAGAVLALVVVLVVGGYHVAGARTAADEVRTELDAGDTAATAGALRDLQAHTAGAGRWLGGAPLTWLTWLPVLGDALDATTTLVSGLDAVATPLAAGTADVLDASGGESQAAVQALHEFAEVFASAGREAVRRTGEIAAIDAAALPGPLSDAVAEGQRQYELLAEAATASAAGAILLPGLLGLDGTTPWLLVASQPAEARGSGAGFFGAVAAMRGQDGAARLAAVHPNDDFYDVPADLGQLPAEFADLWGSAASFVWAHNLTRHFPYAAALLRNSSAAVTEPAQYVVALDPSVVAALLEVTGPVTAAGVTIDAENAEQYLTRDIYQDFPDGAGKDQAASELLAAVFEALQASDLPVADLGQALLPAIDQQRLVAWAADPDEQEVLAWTPLAGGLPAGDLHLTAAINNAAGNKLDAYVSSQVHYGLAGGCASDQLGTVRITLALDDIPPGLPDYVVAGVRGPEGYGGTRVLVHLYGPPGAELRSLTVDGAAAVPEAGSELGRPVWGATLDLTPGRERSVTATFEGDWPGGRPAFLPQPMVQPTDVVVEDARSCPSGP